MSFESETQIDWLAVRLTLTHAQLDVQGELHECVKVGRVVQVLVREGL
jgi:hypothetical protein